MITAIKRELIYWIETQYNIIILIVEWSSKWFCTIEDVARFSARCRAMVALKLNLVACLSFQGFLSLEQLVNYSLLELDDGAIFWSNKDVERALLSLKLCSSKDAAWVSLCYSLMMQTGRIGRTTNCWCFRFTGAMDIYNWSSLRCFSRRLMVMTWRLQRRNNVAVMAFKQISIRSGKTLGRKELVD